jgi:hypothetical protein
MLITYRIPSKKVPYGYIEFQWERASGTGMPDPAELAEEYAQYIKDYQAAEVQAFENPAIRQIKRADKVDEDINSAAEVIKDTLGATEIGEHEPVAPWDNKPDETESTESKPWKKPTASSDWDF